MEAVINALTNGKDYSNGAQLGGMALILLREVLIILSLKLLA